MAIGKAELRELLVAHRAENWRDIQTREWQESIVRDMLAETDMPGPLTQIAAHWQPRRGLKVLDIGSGVGGFVASCRRLGLDAFGIEPDRIGHGSRVTAIEIARRRVDESVFATGIGEQLPFANGEFDLVVLDNVIEHVGDQEAVLREALRVAKDEGVVYVACPNYLRAFEPHYKLRWFPLLPKWIGRRYLRMRGRNPVMLKQLHYTTNGRVHRLIRGLRPSLIVDLNREEFLRKREEASFVSLPARVVCALSKMAVLGRFMLPLTLFYLRVSEAATQFIVVPHKCEERGALS